MLIQATLFLNITTTRLLGHLILISKSLALQNSPPLKYMKYFNSQSNHNSTNYILILVGNYIIRVINSPSGNPFPNIWNAYVLMSI